MKKILVTGAGGFIGSHLTEYLVKKGYEVKAFIRYNSQGNWRWLEKSEVKDKIEVILGDVRDYDSVFKALKDCSSVFHLAALISIPYSYVSPKAYIDTNINGTYNVLQASKELELDNILITSTSETYGTSQYVPMDEKHPIVGQSPYSASKIGADQLATSFFRSYDLPIKIVRPFNTFGPRQSARAVIPTIITQILNNGGKIKLGNINTTRDLTYVKDTVEGFLQIYKTDALIGEIVNIGMGVEISIHEVVSLIAHILNKPFYIIEDKSRLRPTKSEVERLCCDNTKLMSSTSWKPKYTLPNGMQETIKWFLKSLDMYKADVYNI